MPNFAIPDSPPIQSVEDFSRLVSIFEPCGLAAMTPSDQRRFLSILSRGLRLHARLRQPNALGWSVAIAHLANNDIEPYLEKSLAATAELSTLAKTILNQPASFIPPKEQDDCLAYASKVTLTICLKLERVDSKKTSHWINQLFKSGNKDWTKVRSQLHIDHQSDSAEDDPKQVIQEFNRLTEQLKQVSIPLISDFLTKPEPGSQPSQATVDTDSPTSSAPKRARKEPKVPDDVAPDYHLFDSQIFRSQHPDVSDGYRLPNNWNRQSSSELLPTIKKLRTQLRQKGDAHRATRVHAAARFISHFSGLSLKTCLTLPIGWKNRRCKGTMHLDLEHGILRRDALLSANRRQRHGKRRTNGRWWRTYMPPEVISVLFEILTMAPNSGTLGELIHAVGLNHELCQHLLNDGFPCSHKPEDARFANSFRTCLLDLGLHPALVARVSGDVSTTPFSDHFYLTFSEHQVHAAMAAFCNWAGLEAPALPASDRSIGSPKRLHLEEFQKIVHQLNHAVLSEKNKVTARSTIRTVVDFHNLYTKAFVLQIILAHGGRGNLIGRMTFARVFGSNDYLALSDRRTDPYSRQRVVPLTSLLAENNKRYLEHIRAFSKRLTSHVPAESIALERTAMGQQLHNSPFHIYQETLDGWTRRGLKRTDLVDLLVELGRKAGQNFDHESMNVARHFWHTELVAQQIAQPAIESFLGHHTNGTEVFGFGSGVSVREVSDYLRPTLLRVQEKIGFKPLVGLGCTAERYLKHPYLAPPKNLRALPSKLLLQKLAQQDLVIPDVTIREQDPPSTSKTLVAHTALSDLRSRYLQSSLISTHSIGATLFCLVAFELVLTEAEQTAIFMSAVNEGLWRVGEMCVVQAEHNSRAVAQRILQEPTQAAVFNVREKHPDQMEFSDAGIAIAVQDLHKLLIALSPSWPCVTGPDSLKLLSKMASHWAAIEIAPGTLFGVFHKAPLIPIQDLARIFYKLPRACAGKPTPESEMARWSKDARFKDTDKILKKWANKDIPIGEWASRAEGCTKALKSYLSRPDLNLAERMHAELLVADLSRTPPYKTLDTSTLPSYSNKYQRFFKIVQEEDSCDLEPEHFLQAFKDMGGGASMAESALPRWAMLHICAFLARRGHWVPSALTANPATKTPRPPRIPVYTSRHEIECVGRDLVKHFANRGGTYAYARPRLRIERHATLRAAELRYSRPVDYDLENDLLHVTTSGHDHLKNVQSRGSIPLTKDISGDLVGLKTLRQEIDIGCDTLMLADAHLGASYRSFEEISAAIRTFTISRTACLEFRRHDFRSSASTDVCFFVEREVNRLGSGAPFMQDCSTWSSGQLTERCIRFAKAARFSRHASIATTLRFYNCSGPLDLHQQLEQSTKKLRVGGIYAAEVLGTSAQYLYVLKDRRNCRSVSNARSDRIDYDDLVAEKLNTARIELNTPQLQGPSNGSVQPSMPARPNQVGAQTVHACLLAATGLTVETAANALNLRPEVVHRVHSRALKMINCHFIAAERKDSAPALFSQLEPDAAPLPLGISIKSLSRWIASAHLATAKWSLPLRLSMGGNASTLTVVDVSHLEQLLPILKGVSQHGFRVFLRPASGVVVSTFHGLAKKLETAKIEVHASRGKSNGFGTIQFCVGSSQKNGTQEKDEALTNPDDISPRSLGMAGRVVVFGLVIALFTDFSIQEE